MPDPSKVTAGPGWLRLEGIELGPAERPFAREEWSLELGAAGLRWRITRTSLKACRLTADRFPALVLTTQAGRGRYSEIPGFLDTEMRLDGIKGFPVETGAQWYEVVSPRREQSIHFAPSNVNAKVRFTSGFFSYAKAVADGTASAVTLGAESVDRTGPGKAYEPGAVEKQEWSFAPDPIDSSPLDVHLPDQVLNKQLISFAGVYNQWMGWIFGNNPASTPCLHEMGWFPMIHGIQRANPELQLAAERELAFFARTGVDENGYVMPRWWIQGYYKVPWGNLHDQIPHFILAVYYHAVYTGNREFVRSLMPVVRRVAHYMNALDTDGDEGRVRDRIRLYGSAGMYMPPEGYAAEAAAVADLGFRAYKMRPALGPEQDLEAVCLMRQAVGPDFDLMVDAHTWWRMGDRSYRPETVEQLAKSLAGYQIAWLEEPIPPDDHAAYQRLKEKDIVALASGEHEPGEDGYLDLILTEAVDYVQMDVCCQGGYPLGRRLLSEIVRHGMGFAFHSWGTALEVIAAAHLGICWPGYVCEWLEYPCYSSPGRAGMYPFPLASEILKEPLELDHGDLVVPRTAGLGVAVDESVVEHYPWIPGPWSCFRTDSPAGTRAVTADHSVKWG